MIKKMTFFVSYRKTLLKCIYSVAFLRRNMSNFLQPYQPPAWAKNLNHVPKYILQLAHPNTPIHRWNVPGISSRFSVRIKRDDMTGSTLSGNKVRKLEFLLADAIDRGCSHVITAGGIQSNHCRAVAVACRQVGLTPHLLLRSDVTEIDNVGCQGNVLIDRLCGAHLYMVPRNAPYEVELRPRSEQLARMIKEEKGEDSYLIPIGGSDAVGLFGYITMFEELISQGVHEDFDDLVFTCGSGGTAAGLAIANYLTGSKIKIHAVIVSDTEKYFYDHVQDMLISGSRLWHINRRGIRFLVSPEFLCEVSMGTGILLDPTYTGKAVFGFVQELKKNENRFTGTRILFLHTGGMFGLFDGRMEPVLTKTDKSGNKIKMWLNKNSCPE